MPLPITDSPDISLLDSKILADFCAGVFTIDVTPSVFIGSGANNVEGASVKITNPVGVVIRDFITSGYDIVPPMTGNVSVNIPLVAGNFSYGTYLIEVKLTDSDGDEYSIVKAVNICPADKKNASKKEACLPVSIKGNCLDGKVIVMVNNSPNYKGIESVSRETNLELEFPTKSGLPVLESELDSFSISLYQGEYVVTGTVCSLYEGEDNISYNILSKLNTTKKISCLIDECCVQSKIEELNVKLKSDCNDTERSNTSSIILQTLFLLQAAKGAATCGLDPSDFIADLEDLLGCPCTCNCDDGTPIVNNAPATDYTFTGLGFTETTVGLTKNIEIKNYDYELVEGTGISITKVVDDGTGKVTYTISAT